MAKSTLSYGSKGDEVKTLQQFLNGQGYKLTVDGDFGINTQNAVRDFQKKNKLGVDGIVGVNTWGVIDKLSMPSSGNSAGNNSNQGFTYGDYTPGASVTAAGTELDNHKANKPGEYTSKYGTMADEYLNKILNRPDFQYDVNSDALYQQYAEQYRRLGNMAMQDTIGQASAMTGGYGNSYATTAGSQAYQSYLQQLNDVVPELYQMALSKYTQEGQDLYNQYGAIMDREGMDYDRYRDSVSDYYSELSYLTDRYDSERDFDYGKYSDDKGYAYQNYRDSIEDSYTERELSMAEEEWALQKKAYEDSLSDGGNNSGGGGGNNSGSGKGTTSSGVSYDNGSLTTEQVKALQKAIGANADGYYGPNSKKAAGGLSAEEAYEKYVGSSTPKFTGSTYQEACQYVKANGGSASGIMTSTEWQRHKNSGSTGAEVANYDTYQEYLADITEYLLQ